MPLVIPGVLVIDMHLTEAAVDRDEGPDAQDDGDASDDDATSTDSSVEREATRQTKTGTLIVRLLVVAALVVVVVAAVAPLVSTVVAGPALCFRDDDLAATPDACAEGAEVLSRVDKHTRTLYAERAVSSILHSTAADPPSGWLPGTE